MIAIEYPVALISTFLWVGFICAISFMESWIKFRAPGMTISLGLGVGRLVFGVMNKIEWVFAIAILINIAFEYNTLWTPGHLLYLISLVLLLVQTFRMLPALDTRADLVIQGETPPPSNLHIYYVITELIKVTCLVIFGLGLFEKLT